MPYPTHFGHGNGMLDPTSEAASLLATANHLETVREQLRACIEQLRTEPGLSLWIGRARREYDAARAELEVQAHQLSAELSALAADQRWNASVMVSGGFG